MERLDEVIESEGFNQGLRGIGHGMLAASTAAVAWKTGVHLPVAQAALEEVKTTLAHHTTFDEVYGSVQSLISNGVPRIRSTVDFLTSPIPRNLKEAYFQSQRLSKEIPHHMRDDIRRIASFVRETHTVDRFEAKLGELTDAAKDELQEIKEDPVGACDQKRKIVGAFTEALASTASNLAGKGRPR